MRLFSPFMLLSGSNLHALYEWTQTGTYYFNLGRKTTVTLTMVAGGMCYTDSYYAMTGNLSHFQLGGAGGGLYTALAELPAGNYKVEINNSYQVSEQVYYQGQTYTSITATQAVVSLFTPTGVELINVKRLITKSDAYSIIYQKQVIQETDGNSASGYTGGASIYYGYGKGADYGVNNETSGYFKVEW